MSVDRISVLAGRVLLALLFAGGAVQKATSPSETQALLASLSLPTVLIWPALLFNAVGAFCLITGLWLRPMAVLLALYCMVTSVFHLIPSDPWQMSIFVKNWAIAGGLLMLFSSTGRGGASGPK